VDATDGPLWLIVTAGQVADISVASETIEHLRAKAVMSLRSNHEMTCRYSRALHRTRNFVERFFNRIKHFRRISTRDHKSASARSQDSIRNPLLWSRGTRSSCRTYFFTYRNVQSASSVE